MSDLGPSSPFLWIEFDKHGELVDPTAFDTLETMLSDVDATDLVVLSHGWKNDRAAALKIYKPLWENTRAALARDPGRIVVAGVLWPSTPYRPHFDEAAVAAAAQQGALAVDGGGGVDDLDDETLEAWVSDYLDGEDDPEFLARARRAAEDVSTDQAEAFVQELRARTPAPADEPLSEELKAAEQLGGRDTLLALSPKRTRTTRDDVGGALGLGDGIGKVFAGGKAAVARLLGQFTYFDMKVRAGVVGTRLGGLLAARPGGPRLHLVGHSFGARLVTAAASAIASAGKRVDTLTLLQGAFSHNAFAASFEGKPGAFSNVPGEVDVIAITHTHQDRACTLAYAVASFVSQDVASSVGDADDRFGAMGANGAQNIRVTKHVGLPGPGNRPRRGEINNYLADAYILGQPPGKDAHGDVSNVHVGALLAAVIGAESERAARLGQA